MYKYIRKIQAKNEDARKQILVVSLVFSMAIVGSVWAYSLNDRFSDKKITQDTNTGEKPFTLFANSVSSAYQNISASVANFSLTSKNEQTTDKQIDLIPVEYPSKQ